MGTQQTERGIALLRIVFGFWILRSAMAHLVWTPWPWVSPQWVQLATTQLAQYSLEHPSFWVRYLIQQALLPNAETYIGVIAILELLAGLCLTFGLFTVLGALLIASVSLIGGVFTYYLGETALGYFLFQGSAGVVFLFTRAGRRWGVDAFLAGIKSRALLW